MLVLEGNTPAEGASQLRIANTGNTESALALISAGANLDIQENGGWTALMLATRCVAV